MKYQLTAPSYLLPSIAARLALNAPALQYSLSTPQMGQNSPNVPILVFQPDFFHPKLQNSSSTDVFVLPSPLASFQGFMLCAGGSHENLAAASPILDALSPIPRGWLHAGELGAAGFLHQLWLTLTGTANNYPLAAWENIGLSQSSFQINDPNLVNQLSSLMAQQQLISHALASTAKRFLAEHPAQEFTPFHPLQNSLLQRDAEIKISPAHELANLLSSFQIK